MVYLAESNLIQTDTAVPALPCLPASRSTQTHLALPCLTCQLGFRFWTLRLALRFCCRFALKHEQLLKKHL